SAEQLAFVNPLEAYEVEAMDVSIHVLAAEVTHRPANHDASKQALHHSARRPLVDRFLRRAADQSLRWVAAQFPCPAAAQQAGLSPAEYKAFVFAASLLDRPDPVAAWHVLSERQSRLADRLSRVGELRFVTLAGTDLRVGVAGRRWINCDGHQNLPDGEVFTGPVEDATEGTLCLDFPAVHGGRLVEGVRLRFHAGRVVDAAAAVGEEVLHRLLDQDAGARVLGEVALGCNYAVTRHTCNTLFDEKIGGTFHVALGASFP